MPSKYFNEMYDNVSEESKKKVKEHFDKIDRDTERIKTMKENKMTDLQEELKEKCEDCKGTGIIKEEKFKTECIVNGWDSWLNTVPYYIDVKCESCSVNDIKQRAKITETMDKQTSNLEFKDIAMYIPYDLEIKDTYSGTNVIIDVSNIGGFMNHVEKWKPLLRPMLSITEEEEHELNYSVNILQTNVRNNSNDLVTFSKATSGFITAIDFNNAIQWLAKNHLDFQDLIGQGKALDIREYENN